MPCMGMSLNGLQRGCESVRLPTSNSAALSAYLLSESVNVNLPLDHRWSNQPVNDQAKGAVQLVQVLASA